MLLAIDIGGTAVKLALCDREGNFLDRMEAPSGFDDADTPVIDTILSIAHAYVGGREIEGVAISATGQVDSRTGEIIGGVGKTPNYDGAQFGAVFSRAFGVPAHVLNDANAAVLGEWWRGAAQGKSDVVLVTLGTGVGGGVITGGRLLQGARGIGCEAGHFPMYASQEKCPCGLAGCYESYASTTALIARARRLTGEEGLDGRKIFARAKAGEAAMLEALEGWRRDVALGIGGLVHIFNPELVLIGGGVSAQQELLIEPVGRQVKACVMPNFAQGLEVRAAALANSAGLLGAVRFFLDEEAQQ